MSRPSREHLLGFLLDALPPDEQEQVENELNDSPALRAELGRLKESMKRLGLDGPPPQLDPPPGLADRTCAFVREHADRLLVTPVRAAVFQTIQRERHFTWSDFVT